MRVLIVEDHAIVRGAMADLVHECFPEAEAVEVSSLAAMTGSAGESVVPFDFAVLDLVLPRECSGSTTIMRFRSVYPTVPVLATSGLEPSNIVPSIFQAGATAYVPKSEEPEVFKEAIFATAKGERFLPASLAHLLEPQNIGTGTLLGERQMQVLELLAQGQPDKQIARQLGITEDTVAYHVKAIFSALGVSTRAQAVGRGFQVGLLAFVR